MSKMTAVIYGLALLAGSLGCVAEYRGYDHPREHEEYREREERREHEQREQQEHREHERHEREEYRD